MRRRVRFITVEPHVWFAPTIPPLAAHGTTSRRPLPNGDSSLGFGPPHIDEGALAIAEPRRYRNKEHLRFVAQPACLVCGRNPSDPHHLRFMQPPALGRKVSDEFVALCADCITARCIPPTMSAHGGGKLASIPSRSLASCGNTRLEGRLPSVQVQIEPTGPGATSATSQQHGANHVTG
jgi:hypothetical protein